MKTQIELKHYHRPEVFDPHCQRCQLNFCAPELLDLLQSLAEDIADGTFDKNKNRAEYLELIRKAIAKAEGLAE